MAIGASLAFLTVGIAIGSIIAIGTTSFIANKNRYKNKYLEYEI
jgi:hypothetical protein